jgi:ribosomal protein S18 acetylase RimI-like enzyme
MIRFATLEDDWMRLAKLVYETDNIIPFIFGKKDKALPQIKTLIEREDNSFSYKNILVFEDENKTIKGILVAYLPQQKNRKKEQEDYSQVFSILELIILWLKSLLLKSIENKSEIDGLYIQNISVDAIARGEGIGTQLMNYIEKWAVQQGCTSLWLDVAFDNSKAKKLYERQGFSEVSEHKILFSKNGFFRMRKSMINK